MAQGTTFAVAPFPLDDPAGLGPGLSCVWKSSVNDNTAIVLQPTPVPIRISRCRDRPFVLKQYPRHLKQLAALLALKLDAVERTVALQPTKADMGPWKVDTLLVEEEGGNAAHWEPPRTQARIRELEDEVGRLRQMVVALSSQSAIPWAPAGGL